MHKERCNLILVHIKLQLIYVSTVKQSTTIKHKALHHEKLNTESGTLDEELLLYI